MAKLKKKSVTKAKKSSAKKPVKKIAKAKKVQKTLVKKTAKKISRGAVKNKAVKNPASGAKKKQELSLEKIGEVTHYFPHVNAAAVMLGKSGIKVGDQIYIKGHTTDFKEKVDSIQLDHEKIIEGKKGQEIGLRVNSRVRIGDSVYKL